MSARLAPRVRLLVALGAALAVLAPSAPASAADRALSGKRINELAAPAVRLIVVDYDADVAVYSPEVNEAAATDLASDPAALTAIRNGANADDVVIDAIAADPARFLRKAPTPEIRKVALQAVGSGFVVTPDGYVVTNAHVVDSGSDELKQGIVDTALQPLTKELADEAAQSVGKDLTAPQVDKLLKVVVAFVAANIEVTKINTKVSAAEGTQVPGQDKQFKTATAEVVAKGDVYPGKDVALLKVEGRDLATLPLGNDADVDTGEPLYALGYPANVTFLSDFTKSAQSTATLTNGVVSAKKQVSGGYTAIQTDAAISGGNSGGPALDDQGKVVGLTTAGLVSGQDKTGGAYSFVVPVGVAREFLQRSNITPVESQATSLWRSALADIDVKHYKPASATLRRLDSLNPGRPDVQAQLRDSDAKIAAGLDKTPRKGLAPWAIAAIVVGALLLLGLGLLLALRRRRSGRPETGTPPYQGSPYQGSPYQGSPYQGQPQPGQPYQGSPYQGPPYQGQPQPDQPYQGSPYQGSPQQGPPQEAPHPQPSGAGSVRWSAPSAYAGQPEHGGSPPDGHPESSQQPAYANPLAGDGQAHRNGQSGSAGQPAVGGQPPPYGFPIYPGQPGYPDNPPFPGYPVYPGQPGYPERPGS